jgi:hypothetical protein
MIVNIQYLGFKSKAIVRENANPVESFVGRNEGLR